MNVIILDDYFDTPRRLPSFRKLDGHAVAVWNDHAQDVEYEPRVSDVFDQIVSCATGQPAHVADPQVLARG